MSVGLQNEGPNWPATAFDGSIAGPVASAPEPSAPSSEPAAPSAPSAPEPTAAPASPTATPASPASPPTAPSEPSAPSQPAPASPQAPAQPSTQGAAVRDLLMARGLDVSSFESMDDAAILDVLVNAHRQVPQLEELAQYGQWAVQNWDAIQKAMGGQQPAPNGQPQQPAQPAAEPEKPYWDAGPEWDPRLEQFLRRDEQGNIVTVGVNDPTLPARYIARKQWEQDALNRILSDPYGAIEPKVQSLLDQTRKAVIEDVQKWYAETRRQEQDQQFTQSFIQANERALYQTDAQGRLVIDPRTKRPVLSQTGMEFHRTIDELRKAGVSDPVTATNLALKMIGAGQPQAPPANQPGAAPVAPPAPQAPALPAHVAAQERFLGQEAAAAHSPNRAGSFPSPISPSAPPQNTAELGPEELMRQYMAVHGTPAPPAV